MPGSKYLADTFITHISAMKCVLVGSQWGVYIKKIITTNIYIFQPQPRPCQHTHTHTGGYNNHHCSALLCSGLTKHATHSSVFRLNNNDALCKQYVICAPTFIEQNRSITQVQHITLIRNCCTYESGSCNATTLTIRYSYLMVYLFGRCRNIWRERDSFRWEYY